MTGVGPGGEPPIEVNPSGFIAYQISIGSSSREALSAFREAGFTIGTDQFRALYSATYDTILRTPDFMATEPGAIPSAGEWGTWQVGPGGQYGIQVVVQSIDPDTGLISERYFTIMRNEPFSKEEAEAAAMTQFGEEENVATSGAGQQVVGAYGLHGWLTTPWNG